MFYITQETTGIECKKKHKRTWIALSVELAIIQLNPGRTKAMVISTGNGLHDLKSLGLFIKHSKKIYFVKQ